MRLGFTRNCSLCEQKTKIGLIFFGLRKPICKNCIRFIKKLKMGELEE